MSALLHPVEVGAAQVGAATSPPSVSRPAWVDSAMRALRLGAMCGLALLVPGEADRFGSGDLDCPR